MEFNLNFLYQKILQTIIKFDLSINNYINHTFINTINE